MDRYPADPFDLQVVGLEPQTERVQMPGGEVRVGDRRFEVQEVEMVVRQAIPVVWRPKRECTEGEESSMSGPLG